MQNLFLIANYLLVLFTFALGVYSIVKNPKSKAVQHWFILCLAVGMWGIGYILTSGSESMSMAYKYVKFLYIGAILIPILFFHFIQTLLLSGRKLVLFTYVGYLLSIIFLALVWQTEYIIQGVQYLEGFGYYELPAFPGFYYFLLYFLGYSFLAFALLLKKWGRADGVRQKQLGVIAAASLVGFIGGGSNFVTDLTGVYPYGQLIVWLYPALITYGVFIDT